MTWQPLDLATLPPDDGGCVLTWAPEIEREAEVSNYALRQALALPEDKRPYWVALITGWSLLSDPTSPRACPAP